jgi:hypothetical protein
MIISLYYPDFKKVCDEFEKRVYYYQEDNMVNLYFISDSFLVYSFINLNEIENKEIFFQQKMFVGAMKLMFKIPVHDEASTIKNMLMPSIIELVETEEAKAQVNDIQKEGSVESDDVISEE